MRALPPVSWPLRPLAPTPPTCSTRSVNRLWLFVSRTPVVLFSLLPIWLAYVVPFVRTQRFGATIPDERWRRLHVKYAPRFYRLAVRMRGGLIKVGQILSTRADLLPVEWTSTLAGLQDRVAPLPWLEVEPILTERYGRPPTEVFASIDPIAAAAASFGQVHRARTHEGEDVAVKIRYPDVVDKLAIDMFVLSMCLPLFNIFVRQLRLRPIYTEIRRALTTELDYVEEARFTEIIHSNFEGVASTTIPRVVRDLTRPDVIVTTWFEGKKIIDPQILAHSEDDRRALLELVLRAWIKMVYVDGVFQSDPHPGNVLARFGSEGAAEICIVDFGQVKILTPDFHQALTKSVMSFITRDVDGFLDTLVSLGLFTTDRVEEVRPAAHKALERYGSMTPDDVGKMDFEWIRKELVTELTTLRGIVVPQELVLYGRTLALLAGLTRQIDPSVDAFALARPFILEAMLARP